MLDTEELVRYDRQILIPEIGKSGQERLKNAKVFIAGAGGLGSPISIYLAAAGIGTIRLVDCDTVDASNLNRQVLHWEKDVGRKKVESACEKLKDLNPHISIEPVCDVITAANVSKLMEGFDAVVDAMDNLETRFLLNKAAVDRQIPFFHGAVRGFEGRVMTILPGKTACLRCMRKESLPPEKFPVIGVAPALIGTIQATEVIKYFVGGGRLLTDRILLYDGLDCRFTEFQVRRDPNCDHCGHLKGRGQGE
ncbi:MAG: adenylyltransferase [Deltaproteobacteria bacterium HGW-Deltaproteobacteria-21]|nr:MAG: adenylyltransferase [Deltaproteobacteria bacterium HGW-Deltaproteobacteria-21]